MSNETKGVNITGAPNYFDKMEEWSKEMEQYSKDNRRVIKRYLVSAEEYNKLKHSCEEVVQDKCKDCKIKKQLECVEKIAGKYMQEYHDLLSEQ